MPSTFIERQNGQISIQWNILKHFYVCLLSSKINTFHVNDCHIMPYGCPNLLISIICQVREKVQTMDKTSVLRTLKDHIYQCPSKLSEEMVRCMAAVYCWLRSAASVNTETNRSPLLSRSSTNVIQPRRGTGEDQDWTCKSMIEISWISTDKSQFSRASYAINNYRLSP